MSAIAAALQRSRHAGLRQRGPQHPPAAAASCTRGGVEPRVVGTARVDAALPPLPGVCGARSGEQAQATFDRALRDALERTPAVRAFIGPRGAP